MAKKKAEHIHKYQRIKWGKNGTVVWRCMLTNCNHYLHPEMVRNRVSLCWKCLKPYVLTPEKMLRERPKCDGCRSKGSDEFMTQVDNLLRDL